MAQFGEGYVPVIDEAALRPDYAQPLSDVPAELADVARQVDAVYSEAVLRELGHAGLEHAVPEANTSGSGNPGGHGGSGGSNPNTGGHQGGSSAPGNPPDRFGDGRGGNGR
jgi:hypothetical protein